MAWFVLFHGSYFHILLILLISSHFKNDELLRLATFFSFAENSDLCPLKLARQGFCCDGTKGAIRCAGCDIEFDALEHPSSNSMLEKHREQSPCCRFTLEAAVPNSPSDLHRLALSVGVHTASDYASQIGPNDGMQCTLMSALTRATMRGVFQANADSFREPSGQVPLLEEHAHPQVLNQRQFVYRREQPDDEQLQYEVSHLQTFSNWPVNGSGSNSPSVFNAQGSSQGQALYRRDYEQLQCEESRLHTFDNWPVDARVDWRALAREGFFYTGQGDRVQCAFCHGYLKNWKAADVIRTKHQKYSPNCPFLLGLVVSQRPSHEQTSQPSSVDSPESVRNQVRLCAGLIYSSLLQCAIY